MSRECDEERPLTAAPHPLPRYLEERDDDQPTRRDLDEMPLDEALRRMGWG